MPSTIIHIRYAAIEIQVPVHLVIQKKLWQYRLFLFKKNPFVYGRGIYYAILSK
jgi:hypothetical protein